ncbi:MAG: amidohydrolase [Clostridia bacterium]|nr:amidohydrolase [Clostridia bacterium]
MKEYIKSIMEEEKDEVIRLRRELHKRAELSGKEYKTAEFIEEYLHSLGLSTKRSYNTGVVSFLDAKKDKTVLLRADMDALPLTELKDIDYMSETEGVMHACGHDAHMAVLLCTAKVLLENLNKLNVNVLFVFQPAEETDGGAKQMIDEGIMDGYNVTEAAGLHVMTDVPAGKIMIKAGALMASPDDFMIKIIGRGGHGSMPEKSKDPIPVAAGIIDKLNAITNDTIVEGEKQVVQVCMFNAGTSSNVIPDFVELKGTTRSFVDGVRYEIPKRMESIVKSVCEKSGFTYEFCFNYQYPPLINDATVADKMQQAVTTYMGDIVINWEEPSMGGEDFAYFAQKVPSNFFYLGTGNEEKGITKPIHNSHFEIDEDALIVGVGVYLSYLFGAF